MRPWNRFLLQLQKDAKLWLAFVFLLFLFRLVFVFFFRHSMAPGSGPDDFLWMLFSAIRFDTKTSTALILVPFLLSIAASVAGRNSMADRFRLAYGAATAIIIVVASVATVGYFKEYNDQFNHFIVNLYYDDTKAIFATIWNSYHPIPNLIAATALSYGVIRLMKRFLRNGIVSAERTAAWDHGPAAKGAVVLLVLALLVAGVRGSVGRQPLRHRDAGITRDEFLNKAALNPVIALYYAIEEYYRFSGNVGLNSYLPDRNVGAAARAVFAEPRTFDSLDDYFRKTARGPKAVPPRHVVLILMESYDSWPLLDRYQSLHITDNLKRIGNDGLWFKRFLPASDSTMQSFAVIVTSFPYTSVEINYQTASRAEFPTSLPGAFRKLGYRTRLFYGGFLSWQRMGDFAKAQGFDEVYGGPDMGSWIASNEWGVEDEALFAFAEKKIDAGTPSFDLVLTTSYHPPYDMDVWAKGFPLRTPPADLAPLMDNGVTLRMLGHLWYQDRCIGQFVKDMSGRLPRALFAFTGDHYGRKYLGSRPTFYERSAVPFILYGKDVLRGLSIHPGAVGSHEDIGATLIELAAPKGFTYYSMGDDLLARRGRNVGIGWWKVMGPDYLFDVRTQTFHPLPDKPLPAALPEPRELTTLLNRYYGMGWWRVKKGALLDVAKAAWTR